MQEKHIGNKVLPIKRARLDTNKYVFFRKVREFTNP